MTNSSQLVCFCSSIRRPERHLGGFLVLVYRPKGMNLLQIPPLSFLLVSSENFLISLFVSRKLLVIWPDRCLQNETKSTTCGCCIIEIFLRFDVKRLKALHRSEVWRWHASRTRSYVTRRGRLWVCFVHSRETSSILHKMGGAMSRKQDFSTIYVKTSLTLWNFKLSQSGFLLKEQFCTIIEHVVHFFHWCFDAWKQPLNPQMKSRLLRG